MDRPDLAVSIFKEGFSCSQAVLRAYSEMFGLDQETALKISQPFGGGTARMGGICGAVNGAFMVIGLKHGRVKAEDIQAREKTYEVMREFIKRFASLHNSIICNELLGCDVSTEEGHKLAEEKRLFQTVCPVFVQNAVEILEQLL